MKTSAIRISAAKLGRAIKNEKPHPLKSRGLRRKWDVYPRMLADGPGRKRYFTDYNEKLECFVMLGSTCLKAKMPHEQTLWAVAINDKLWFEALRWQGFCARFCTDQRSREILR
ncbi:MULTISPECIES: hypothetical protein [unclassified Rhizobium]|uniref:hypothetical protein n=1 Tax=unclassified Rhizobium TaxID=2613769 RepID=UPI00160C2CDB|nr:MULTISPECIES: hypothetical protein [unclassified Rhizobium]MBB3396785.1 hypothetical protein [Rhizobium sp. BK060]MBB4168074.1 hypothetical protein [Rhizobium sp. BK538]